jgi:DNA phosphorothioation-dependent restriction protein DptG
VANRLKISRTTATNIIKKVRISMASCGSQPMISQVYMDEFVFGGKEIRKIFDKHISKSETIKTDKWTGYNPLKKSLICNKLKVIKATLQKNCTL